MATLGANAAPASALSDRERAVTRVAVAWTQAIQRESFGKACDLSIHKPRAGCDFERVSTSCGSPAPRVRARTAAEQVGRIEFVGGSAKVRFRAEARTEDMRARLVLRRVDGRWRVALARFRDHRTLRPYDPESYFVRKFFLGPCIEAVYR